MNYRREKKFRDRGWVCLGCRGLPSVGLEVVEDGVGELQGWALETDKHLLCCLAYLDLQEHKNMSADAHLIEFYKKSVRPKSLP